MPPLHMGRYVYQRRWPPRKVHERPSRTIRGDIDGAIDDFLATLKRDARQLLRECAKITPVLSQFHWDFITVCGE